MTEVKWVSISDYVVDKVTKELEELSKTPLVWNTEKPIQLKPELSFKEIQEKIDYYWNNISKETTYQEYFENWKQYDFYVELKKNYKNNAV
tara:strand:+ start:26236 stop:26508 length:273 start_codon:yes stop_codon:yes gene_type:complete